MQRGDAMRTIITAAAAVMLGAAPAAAVVKVATYSGTLASGQDRTGVFGPAGGDLGGAAFVASFTYDKALGGSQSTDGSTYQYSFGGVADGNGSPIVSASITINGFTKALIGDYYGVAYTTTSPFTEHYAVDYVDTPQLFVHSWVYIDGHPVDAPWSLDQDFGPAPVSGASGHFTIYRYDYTTAQGEWADGIFDSTATYWVHGVPEPASWALMIAGFGFIGAARRRQDAAFRA